MATIVSELAPAEGEPPDWTEEFQVRRRLLRTVPFAARGKR